jgi:hypothetical protein
MASKKKNTLASADTAAHCTPSDLTAKPTTAVCGNKASYIHACSTHGWMIINH